MARVLVLILSLLAAPVLADRDDHDRALRALEAGEILPLADILAVAGRVHPGRVIEIELERDDGRWVYKLELVSPEGFLYELEIDGASGAVLEVEREEAED